MLEIDETIVAIASTPMGYRGIVRISGDRTQDVLKSRFSQPISPIRFARRMTGYWTCDDPLGQVPCQLYYWPDHRSYTRQPTAELHTIGARPILDSIVDEVCRAGARLARPGEFTLRAFMAGRIDLAQAEAVLGVIDAMNARQLKTALGQLAGGLSTPLCELRESLLNLLADIEAGLDFVDEEIQFISANEISHQLQQALNHVQATIAKLGTHHLEHPSPTVVLRGEPNVGKSSLWNLLTDSRAIVSPQAGTTRDYLVGTMIIGESRVQVIDTPGYEPLEETTPASIPAAMQQMGHAQANQADVMLICIDGTRPLTDWETSILNRKPRPDGTDVTSDRIVVVTKSDQIAKNQSFQYAHVQHPTIQNECDRNESNASEYSLYDHPRNWPTVITSARTGQGIDALRQAIASSVSAADSETQVVKGTATRCRESLRLTADALEQALSFVHQRLGDEFVVTEIRIALDHLGEVVGAVYTEDLLDRIFSRFCIGK